MKSWISIILALVFLSAVVIFNIRQPKPLPAPQITPSMSPTTTLEPTVSQSACQITDLNATITFEGAAGSLYGTAKLTNTSSQECTLVLNQTIQLTYLPTIKNISVNYTAKPSGITYTLKPQGSLYAQIRMQNGPQCQSPLNQVQASLTYPVLPGQMVTFLANNKPEFLINACQADTDITQIDIASLSATPVQ